MRSPLPVSPSGDEHSPPFNRRQSLFFTTSAASSKQQPDKMPSKHKHFEYYTLGCISLRTESLALCVGVQFLLTNVFLLWLSLQGWHPYWRLALPAVINAGASLALLYAWWADKSSYSLFFLIVNFVLRGVSICALALSLFALLLIETDPTLLKQFIGDDDGGTEQHQLQQRQWTVANYVQETEKGTLEGDSAQKHQAHVRQQQQQQRTIAGAWRNYAKQLELSGWLREAELGLVLVLLLLWVAQGIVCHFYRYAKLRKVERFERAANGCATSGAGARVSASRASGTNFRIPVATLRRLQHVQQQQKQMPPASTTKY